MGRVNTVALGVFFDAPFTFFADVCSVCMAKSCVLRARPTAWLLGAFSVTFSVTLTLSEFWISEF